MNSQAFSRVRKSGLLLGAGGLGFFACILVLRIYQDPERPMLPEPAFIPAANEPELRAHYAAFERFREVAPETVLPEAQLPSERQTIAQAEDAEWEHLPRKSVPRMPQYLMSSSARSLDIRTIFRHTLLNRHDTYVSRVRRDQLKDELEGLLKRLAAVQSMLRQATTLEMNLRIAQGTKRPLVFNTQPSTLAFLQKHRTSPRELFPRRELYEGGERIDRFLLSGGTLYGYSYEEFPNVRPILDYELFFRTEIAGAIGNWLVANGLMNAVDSASFFQSVLALAEEASR